MSMNGPIVEITCDSCGRTLELPLTEIVCQSDPAWDLRNLPKDLERNNFFEVENDEHLCSICFSEQYPVEENEEE